MKIFQAKDTNWNKTEKIYKYKNKGENGQKITKRSKNTKNVKKVSTWCERAYMEKGGQPKLQAETCKIGRDMNGQRYKMRKYTKNI